MSTARPRLAADAAAAPLRTAVLDGPVEPSAARRRVAVEWPTIALLGACYGVWAGALLLHETIGWPLAALIAAYATALHASLQHEALHGHPTRSAAVNEALIFPSLILMLPYRRIKELHLRHHRDERLTDPYDDPESFYLTEADHDAAPGWLRWLLRRNRSLGGRMVFGPWLSVFGLYRLDWSERARPKVRDAYLRHALGAGLVIAFVWGVADAPIWLYALTVVWPAYALLMVRTFAEHRAAQSPDARTAIVESGPVMSLLFLNNNLHAVHHAHPTEPWYALPEIWRRERADVLARNGGYYFSSYGEILRRWLFSGKEPIAHPIMRRRP